jgi:hypothetical protein
MKILKCLLFFQCIKKDGAHQEAWAVSQAAPLRRVEVNGLITLQDYCSQPNYASGGFIADSKFTNTITSGSQQQWVIRNSQIPGWSNGVWNKEPSHKRFSEKPSGEIKRV